MPFALLRIKWGYATEFVSIDPDNESIIGSHINTTEFWHEEREVVKYTALCTNFSRSDAEVRISLEYRENENISLKRRNDTWGVSHIDINLKTKKVKATWADERRGSAYSGKAKSCSWLEDNLLDEMSYETISRIARPKQSALRKDLLQAYGMCAITGETTAAVLDAAHIIEAGKKGSYTINNCFLLRTDLHRLFDRGYLNFLPTGGVVLSPEVRGRYSKELAGKELSLDVMLNVKEALVVRYGRSTGD